MRDIALVTVVAAVALLALKKPQIGILGWLWISVASPHNTALGFAKGMPILDGLVALTLLSCLVHWKERASAEFLPILKLLLVFYLWCSLTTVFSIRFSLSSDDWLQFTKILLLVVCMLVFMNKKHWIVASVGVFLLAVGYTSIKGGIFTILTGGGYRVWGPPGSMWSANNAVSMACLLALPMTVGIASVFVRKMHRVAIYGTAVLSLATILGTQSRGALVGLLAMSMAMMVRAQRKLLALFLVPVFLVLGFIFMPQSWHERMVTIQTFEEDSSAQTRLIQWRYAIDISLERPLFGNGFDAFYYKPYYYKYVAHKDINRSVHSNYFQVLGEQGFIGLAMYLLILASVILNSKNYAIKCGGREDLKWAGSLVGMLQFSVIGYAANGLTLNLAYFDLFYYVLAIAVLLISHIRQELGLNVAQPVNYRSPGQHEFGAAQVKLSATTAAEK